MKVILGIRKLFWYIDSVLIAILIYIIAGLIQGNSAGVSSYAYPIRKEEELEIMPFTRSLLPVEHKVIIEHNIFGSSGLRADRKDLQRKDNNAPLSAIKKRFRLCATVAGDNQIACAVIEDLRSRRQDIYKTGEIIGEARIEEIGRNRMVLFCGGQLEVLDLHISHEVLAPVERDEGPVMARKHDPTEPMDDILPMEREINKGAFNTQVPAIKVFLEKVELSSYIIGGQEEGLCITGLDDLSFARNKGFENGDVIQKVNGQILTNKQKAFQVLKKARSQSPICVQLLRNQRKVELTFETK
jgi:type II secretory pathway component PulC